MKWRANIYPIKVDDIEIPQTLWRSRAKDEQRKKTGKKQEQVVEAEDVWRRERDKETKTRRRCRRGRAGTGRCDYYEDEEIWREG